jgi:hypothetical protein
MQRRLCNPNTVIAMLFRWFLEHVVLLTESGINFIHVKADYHGVINQDYGRCHVTKFLEIVQRVASCIMSFSLNCAPFCERYSFAWSQNIQPFWMYTVTVFICHFPMSWLMACFAPLVLLVLQLSVHHLQLALTSVGRVDFEEEWEAVEAWPQLIKD